MLCWVCQRIVNEYSDSSTKMKKDRKKRILLFIKKVTKCDYDVGNNLEKWSHRNLPNEQG